MRRLFLVSFPRKLVLDPDRGQESGPFSIRLEFWMSALQGMTSKSDAIPVGNLINEIIDQGIQTLDNTLT